MILGCFEEYCDVVFAGIFENALYVCGSFLYLYEREEEVNMGI